MSSSPNGTSHATGIVEQVNARHTGIKVGGEWLNVSQYHPLSELPKVGQRIEVQVERTERGVWIQGIEVLDDGRVHELPAQSRRAPNRGQSDVREIRRLGCLKAAAIFAAGKCLGGSSEVKTTDVLKVAEAFERWVES